MHSSCSASRGRPAACRWRGSLSSGDIAGLLRDVAGGLRFLEPVTLELQRATVLADGAHHVLRHAFRDVRGDVQAHGDVRADNARQAPRALPTGNHAV